MTLARTVQSLIPRRVWRRAQPVYHWMMAFFAAVVYGFPSRRLRVVGVTGTTGKTTVVALAAQVLRAGGMTVGYTSTALLSDGRRDWLNDKKMTMIGRLFTQKMLRAMVKNGCDVAIVETTSEGIVQFRHRWINYDVVLITGLYPEHLESHGGFDNYKKAKQQLFTHMHRSRGKTIRHARVPKTAIVNCDDPHVRDFCILSRDHTIGFTAKPAARCAGCAKTVVPYAYDGADATGLRMRFADHSVRVPILGAFNVGNAAAAGCVGLACGMSSDAVSRALAQITPVPGRLERIDGGQDFTVIVDYAFEPVAVEKLYETVAILRPRRITHVLGATGGGRDRARRRVLGRLARRSADTVIITNEDPYDEDPMAIMREVRRGAREVRPDDATLCVIPDRYDAIAYAIAQARTGDVVLVTGKGCEQAIAESGGRYRAWDDRTAVRTALRQRLAQV